MTVISVDTFRYIKDPLRARSLFAESVTSVEIEIFSYCNRVCSFCTNAVIDRRGRNTLMDPALYSKIIDDLAEIDYAGIIWYSRYNEPTSDRVFLDRLREARAKLPNARLQTYTNGDYLDADYISDLRASGLDELKIMAYLPNGTAQTQPAFLNLMMQRLEKLGVKWHFTSAHNVKLEVEGIDVSYNYEFFLTAGTNRGGVLPTGGTKDRQSPCTLPITSLYIDYNGSMVPCCDIRSDIEAHKDFVIFRMTPQASLFEAYGNSRLVEWRRSLSGFGPKKAPCDTCNRNVLHKTPEMQDLFAKVSALSEAAIAAEQARPTVHSAPSYISASGKHLCIVVPTRDSAAWIGGIAAAYETAGVRPLFVVDSRSADNTLALLHDLRADVTEVTPEEDYVEDITWRIPALTGAQWLLRLDDDEMPSRALFDWVQNNLHALTLSQAAFSRRWAMRDARGMLGYARHQQLYYAASQPDLLDPQIRLFRPDRVRFTRDIHTPGFTVDGGTYIAPSEAFICHFDWILRSFEQRRAKVLRYETHMQGRSASLVPFYLPELLDPESLRMASFETAEFAALANDFARARSADKTGTAAFASSHPANAMT